MQYPVNWKEPTKIINIQALGPHSPEQLPMAHAVLVGGAAPQGSQSPGQVLLAVALLWAHSPVETGPVLCCCPHIANRCWGSH